MRLCKKARRARARFSECLVMYGVGVSGRMKDERTHPAEVGGVVLRHPLVT